MNRYAALAAIILTCALGSTHAQAPAPATPASNRRLLETLRETNAKLIEQQAKTLQLLEEMEKTSQTLKLLGKRA